MRKRLCLILIVILIFTNAFVYSESFMGDQFRSYLLADYNTGEILEAYNIDEIIEIASISKLMTYLVVMDKVTEGYISLEDKIIIDKDTAKIGGSSLKLKEGEIFTVDDLLKGAIIASGNDAVYALSKHIAGTEIEFVKLMNAKAKEIGLSQATFYNSSGLPIYPANVQNMMTTVDIFKLSQHIIGKYPQILEIGSQRAMKMVDRNYYGRNTNPLLKKIDGIDGLKTGFTNAAGWSYVSTFKIDEIENETKDLRLISIIMGCEAMHTRNIIARNLIESAIDNYSDKILLNKNNAVDILELPRGQVGEIDIFPKKDYSQIIKKSDHVELFIYKYEDIEFPIRKNQKIGTIEVLVNDEVVFKTDAIAKMDVNKGKWHEIFLRRMKSIFTGK